MLGGAFGLLACREGLFQAAAHVTLVALTKCGLSFGRRLECHGRQAFHILFRDMPVRIGSEMRVGASAKITCRVSAQIARCVADHVELDGVAGKQFTA